MFDVVESNMGIDIGSIIKKARANKDWTQKELSERMNVSQPQIADWENGKRRIYGDDLMRIAVELDIVEELFPGYVREQGLRYRVGPQGTSLVKQGEADMPDIVLREKFFELVDILKEAMSEDKPETKEKLEKLKPKQNLVKS